MTPAAPVVHYWRLYTDAAGVSRLGRCEFTEFRLQSMQPPAAPQWQSAQTRANMTVLVTVQPVGWLGTWHENPKPQWIVPLSGRWFVESMDGTHIEMGAGEISFGGDQNCRAVGEKRGHLSGTVGDVPAVLMVIQFNDAALPASTCAVG
jgi:hypothetical protein